MRGQRGHLFGECVRGYHLECARGEEFADFRPSRNLDQRVPHLMNLGEAFQDRDQAAVLALRDLEVDDVVVEVVFARPRGDGDELFAGRVDQN